MIVPISNRYIKQFILIQGIDKVRILEKKEKIDKGKQKISKELYTLDKGKDIDK